MRRSWILGLTIAICAIGASAALATNPHFVTGPTCTQAGPNTISCAGKIAGLGSGQTGLYVVVIAPAGCINNGGNTPNGQASVASGPFTTDKSGNLVFGGDSGNTVTASGNPCPGTQQPTISNTNTQVAVYQCSSGGPTFTIKKGQSTQTNPSCTLLLGPVAAA